MLTVFLKEPIVETEIDDTDVEFNFFSQKNRANSTGFPGAAADADDSVNFSDLDLSGIEWIQFDCIHNTTRTSLVTFQIFLTVFHNINSKIN